MLLEQYLIVKGLVQCLQVEQSMLWRIFGNEAALAEKEFACAAVKQIESPGPCILNETSDSVTMRLDSLCVHIPDGSRHLCQVVP